MHLDHHERRIDRDHVLADACAVLAEVYGYLLHRCGSKALAEDLSSESLLAAVDRLVRGEIDRLSAAYVIGIARHKLVDHWRREERERRHLVLHTFRREPLADGVEFEPGAASAVLSRLGPAHRAALTLRYVDDLSVPAVAELLGRSVASTETLLMRAKQAFRDLYHRTVEEHDV